MMPEGDKLKISWDDLKKPQVDAELKRQSQAQPQGTAPAPSPGEKAYPPPRQYGSITPMPTQTAGGGLLYSAVFYTAVAGLLGALLAWIISELIVQHALTQDASISPGLKAAVFFATVGAILGLALCAVEGIISRNYSAAAISGIIGIVLGMIGGGLAGGFGQALYELGAKEKQSVILTLDISGSMDGGPLTDLKSSSRRFIDSADPKTVAIGVVTFSDEANVISPPTENAAMLASAVDDLKASGETNMVGGLKQAHSLLEGKPGRRAVLLFTDGKPNKYEGMQDLQTLLDAEMKRQNLTVETLVSRELAKKDLQLSDLASLSEEKRRDYIQDVLIQFCDDSGILKQIEGAAEAATEAEAKKMRDAGIEIIAIGTGDAERGFLARLAGSNEKVLLCRLCGYPYRLYASAEAPVQGISQHSQAECSERGHTNPLLGFRRYAHCLGPGCCHAFRQEGSQCRSGWAYRRTHWGAAFRPAVHRASERLGQPPRRNRDHRHVHRSNDRPR